MKPWVVAGWFAGLLFACGASWLIWNHAPLRDGDLRFALALSPLVVWAVLPVLLHRSASALAPATENPQLRDLRRAVLTHLADRGLKGGRARYSLPFYLVLGSPGSGKSSLLEASQSGLGMPKSIGQATWWVGKEAVFVEAALGSGGTAHRDLYELLRRLRPALPVNGVLLVASPADLALADQAEQRMITQAISDELRELEDVTGSVVPTYLLLSKIDLIPGFREFFDRQEPGERSQPWGFALPFGHEAVAQPSDIRDEKIAEGFRGIVSAMRLRHMEWLSREADPVRCSRIHAFSAQIAALQHSMRPVLNALASEQTRVWKGALLRGLFLTSARQEPLTIDALLPDLSRRFAMPRIGTLPPDLGLDDEDHGYFVEGAFKRAIFPEAGLAMRRSKRRVGPYAQWAAIAALVAAGLAGAYAGFHIFDEEVRLSARVAEAGAARSSLPARSTLAGIPAVVRQFQFLDVLEADIAAVPAPPAYALGLSSRAGLRAALRQSRRDLRANALMPHLSALLETQLVDEDADTETLRERIRAAESAAEPASAILHGWLEASAEAMDDTIRTVFVAEGMEALREAPRLEVDPAYLDAARRLVAYRESLS